jgi:hypothetical protein
MVDFNPDLHPRGALGRWTESGGSDAAVGTKVTPKSEQDKAHEQAIYDAIKNPQS